MRRAAAKRAASGGRHHSTSGEKSRLKCAMSRGGKGLGQLRRGKEASAAAVKEENNEAKNQSGVPHART